MKKIFLGILIIVGFNNRYFAQNSEGRVIPAIDLKTVDGKIISSSKFSNNGKPMIIDFWATWCKPCKKELDAISEDYTDWTKETGVKLIAISIDESRSSSKVGTDAKSHGWDFEVYIDENQDFKRAMNVGDIPQVFVINGNGEIVWQHSGYVDGSEAHLLEIIKKVERGEKIVD